MTGHLFESTLILAIAILLAQMPRLAARTRYAIVFAALMKFAVPSAIVPRILAFLGIDLARMPKGAIVIEALGPLSAADGVAPPVSRWPAILISLWLLIAIGLLIRALLRGRAALRGALTDGCDASHDEQAVLARALVRTRLARPVRLVCSQSILAPATAGMLRPVILIPAATQLSTNELETILTHECAHIARHDNLLGLIESVAACALWFHPLVWIARHILDAAREEACDAVVVASGDSDTYINALRKVCEAAIGPRVAAVSCIVSNTIRERMEAIMTFGTRRLLNHRDVIAVVVSLLTITTLGIGVARALPPESAANDSPRLEVTLSRDAGGIYLFEIAVRDRATNELITSAKLKAHAEEPATMDSSSPEMHIRAIAHQDGTADVETRFKGGSPAVTRIVMKSGAASGSQFLRIPGDSPLRVGGDVKPPVIINRVEPIYPALAKESKISGIVILEVVIDHTGVVKDVRVLKPLPFGLDQAAVDAVKQWTFRPATLNGQAVDVLFNLTINFRSSEHTSAGISLNLKDADLRDVLKTFAQLTNTQIIADDDVKGQVTIDVADVPWMDAFEILVRQNNLRYERDGN
ncbi:MAG TPA: TonB family protein, partial [Thermoanaerobaculia bacterium]|nr:TonB family protein [Thermoanaerobaculia bacterium]